MNPKDLPHAWREQADVQRDLAAEGQACTFEHCAKQLEVALDSYAKETLTISQAAIQSGYNEETLRRLVREGVIPNAGRPNAPRIRRADLPLKPGHRADGHAIRPRVDSTTKTATLNGGRPRSDNKYDPEEDARDIAKLLEAKS